MLPETSLFQYLADLEDPRIEKNQDHPFINVLVIAILGGDLWSRQLQRN